MFLPLLIRVSFYTAGHSLVLSKKVHFPSHLLGPKGKKIGNESFAEIRVPCSTVTAHLIPPAPSPWILQRLTTDSGNQIQTHVSQQYRRLPQFYPWRPSQTSSPATALPFTTVQPPWPPPTSAPAAFCLILPTFLDKSSSFLPFHVFNHFWKGCPS